MWGGNRFSHHTALRNRKSNLLLPKKNCCLDLNQRNLNIPGINPNRICPHEPLSRRKALLLDLLPKSSAAERHVLGFVAKVRYPV